MADTNDDLEDCAVCDPKAIQQTVVTVPDVRYRNVFANLMPAVRAILQFNFYGLILCSIRAKIF
ncbi:hypothetical protein DPMN_189612 [Dreissena polymorpha]|uniref:Uncharacterized protein n=1 Tax=Dreissena polymorpha TaxID=45954 RepID=A0A9D4ICD1_DREPO|nr:hypothetical protein DPMN_189612 [Dreissena polymorpha]